MEGRGAGGRGHAAALVRALEHVLTGVIAFARALAGLVWPVDCAGCGRPDVALCSRCAAAFAGRPFAAAVAGSPVPVWGLSAYEGIAAQVIVAWKQHGRHDLSRPLGRSLSRAVRSVLEAQDRPAEVWLVPLPARPAALRQRGADLPCDLARRAAGAARASPHLIRVVPVLRHTRRVRDQVGLDYRERRQNLAGALAIRPGRAASLTGRLCIVIDDIVTTGASVAEAVRVLTDAGALVVGVCCLSVTSRQRGVLHGPEATSLTSWKVPSGS